MESQPAKIKGIAATFRKWLLLAFVAVLVLSIGLSWFYATSVLKRAADAELEGQLAAIESAAESYDFLDGSASNGGMSQEAAKTDIANMLAIRRASEDGIAVIATNGVVVASDPTRFEGMPYEGLIKKNNAHAGIFGLDAAEEWNIADSDVLYYAKTKSGVFSSSNGPIKYDLAVAVPVENVYRYRAPFAGWVVGMLAALLIVICVVVMILLRKAVLRYVDGTNAALGDIMAGDLDRKVAQSSVSEFNELSDGINATVGVLKGSMAEIEGRIDRELATAKAIQESALPNAIVPFPEIDAFDLYASMKAAKEIGGDFYDFFLLEGDRIGIVIADVSGKGIPAALFMMSAKTEIRTCMESEMGLVESLKTANYQLCQGNDAGMFVTVFAAVLDYRTGKMEYVNAGHNPPLVRHGGEWTWLRGKSGLFLGAYPKLKLESRTLDLVPSDELLLYTDGVTEARNQDEDLYGEERLESFLNANAKLGPQAIIRALERDLGKWAKGTDQTDDITMLALEYGVPPLSTDTIEVYARKDELDRVTAFVNAELARRLCPVSVQNKVDICLEELFVNVANYAYGDSSGKVRVAYTFIPEPCGIKVDIIDEGIPFDPLEKDDPDLPSNASDLQIGGLGIFMTKNMADSISYEYRDGQNITTFVLRW